MYGAFSYYFFSSGIVGGDDVIDGGKGDDTIAGDQFYAQPRLPASDRELAALHQLRDR